MSLKIRLKRMGMKKQPSYRIVVADARKPRDTKSIEVLGSYSPQRKDKPLVLDLEKVDKWIAAGAQPTEPARKLVERARKVADQTGEKLVSITSKPKEKKPKAKAETEKPESEPEVEESKPEKEPEIVEAPAGDAESKSDAASEE